jgi:hypothetical protein
MPSTPKRIHNKSHGKHKSSSSVGRRGRATLRARTRQLKTVGKQHEAMQEDKNPASVIQKVHLFEKQRDFLSAQAEVFERRTASLREEIDSLSQRISLQHQHAQAVFEKGGAEEVSLQENMARVAETEKSSVKKQGRSKKTSTGSRQVFSIKY